ncbi:MAG: tetraacyldisaccharide 4'-kinase [Chitinophagaceae bacterium]|nr:MAG: tetraacyldisaccharide 4'-kinase [Chitinophagaceae bacterium]
MFSNLFLKSFRILLFPFALLYWLGIAIRNWLYDKNISRSTSFGLPMICVGNLSVGGTGKSPMVEYLIRLLREHYPIATLSRGYKRKTSGYALAGPGTTALDIGDEPMQFHKKFPEIPVAVGEKRIEAVPQLLHDRPDTEVIILDDAFQHRAITAGLNILLTEYSNLFTRDFYLPTGDLRDLKSSYKRAGIIVVTKCPPQMTEADRAKIIKEIRPLPTQPVFFTCIQYGTPYHLLQKHTSTLSENLEVLLVTGIANPKPLEELLEEHTASYSVLRYSDHHIFTIDDLKEIRNKFTALSSDNKFILTTEKDAVRLQKFNTEIIDLPLYVIPVQHHFLFSGAQQFNQLVINFIQSSGKREKHIYGQKE